MRRVICAISAASALILIMSSMAQAQPRSSTTSSDESFSPGYMDVGPVVGIGGIGDASLSIGGRFEYGILRFSDLGNGVLSFAGAVDHYSYSSFGFSTTPIGATLNYHFKL